MLVKRGDIFYADLGTVRGSEQGGIRPVLVVQNDIGNKYSPTVIVAPITSQDKTKLPTHVSLDMVDSGLPKKSTVMMEQVRTLDKSRLKERVGSVNMALINASIAISMGLNYVFDTKNQCVVCHV